MASLVADKAHIFTDGASKGNPGPGGLGFIILYSDGSILEGGKAFASVTNNQMELLATINALEKMQAEKAPIVVYTDSSYVVNGIGSWVKNWLKNDWQTSTGKPVANKELWKSLWDLSQGKSIQWKHVYGHVGIPGNERADEIADHFAQGLSPTLFSGPFSQYSIDLLNFSATLPSKLKGKNSKNKSKGKKASYLSMVNGVLARHQSWSECEARVKGRSGAKFKKAFSMEEEEQIKNDWGVS